MKISALLISVLCLSCFGCASTSIQSQSRQQVSPHKIKIHKSHYYQVGKASYYADKYQNRKTASGELFDQRKMTAAHPKLPFGTVLRVTNLKNGKSVMVRVNDRGPYGKGLVVDLSRSAFSAIGNTASGLIDVGVEILKK